MLESQFQKLLIGRIKAEFPDAIVLKNDPTYIQGIPDLLVLYGDKWAALECKAYSGASVQPNQQYWLEKMQTMAFAAFANPQNMENILEQLGGWFGDISRTSKPRRSTRVPKSK